MTAFVTITLADADHWPELHARAQQLGAYCAVLQGDGPPLVALLDGLVDRGVVDCTVVAVTFEEAGVPASWVGHVARWWLSRQGRDALTIRFVSRAVRGLPSALPDPDRAKILRPNGESLTNNQWAEPPSVHTHLLVCRGPRCTAKGAAATLAALGEELHRREMLDAEVLVTQTGCLYPCNKAPVVAIQPDMAWLGPVPAEEASAVVDQIQARPACAKLSCAPG